MTSRVDTDGKLVLTDGASQHHAAFFKGRAFSQADEWGCSFVWSASIPSDSPYAKAGNEEALADGTTFLLQPTPDAYHSYSTTAAAAGSYGFAIRIYGAGSPSAGIRWIDDGVLATLPDVPDGTEGISVTKPIRFTIRCRNGVLAVRMEQEGRVVEFTRDVSPVFANGARAYFGFTAATSWWGSTSIVPWSCQTVEDFSGWLAKPNAMTVLDTARGNLKASNWKTSGDTYRSGEAGAVRLVAGASKQGFLLNTTPFPAHRPFKLTFECKIGEFSGTGAEGFSCGFQKGGVNVAHPGGAAYVPSGYDLCGFVCYVYTRAIGWVDNSTHTPVDRIANTVDMTPDLPNTFELVYDGAGGLTVSVTSANKTETQSRFYPEMLTWGDDMYLTFLGATAGWTHCRIRLAEMAVYHPETENKSFRVPFSIGVAEESSASVRCVDKSAFAALSGVALEKGSTLTFASTDYETAYSIGSVSVLGDASLVATGLSVARINGPIVYPESSSCALGFAGSCSFAEHLRLMGSASWSGSDAAGTLLDYTRLASDVARPSSYELVDEDGADLLSKRRFAMSCTFDRVKLTPCGFA